MKTENGKIDCIYGRVYVFVAQQFILIVSNVI